MAVKQCSTESLNLFRRNDAPDFYCAVPERAPVPHFIRTPRWEFAGKLSQANAVPVGFRERAARIALQHQGFYPFDRID